LQNDWTPVFTGVTTEIQFFHSFTGDEMKGDYVLELVDQSWAMPEKRFTHSPGYRGRDTEQGARGRGLESGWEGNDKAIVKRTFLRETSRNQRQD
jgi:hypothetical protein